MNFFRRIIENILKIIENGGAIIQLDFFVKFLFKKLIVN